MIKARGQKLYEKKVLSRLVMNFKQKEMTELSSVVTLNPSPGQNLEMEQLLFIYIK